MDKIYKYLVNSISIDEIDQAKVRGVFDDEGEKGPTLIEDDGQGLGVILPMDEYVGLINEIESLGAEIEKYINGNGLGRSDVISNEEYYLLYMQDED